MKLPSMQEIGREFFRLCSRFPLVVINALVGTAAALVLIDHQGPSQPTVFVNILLAAGLGFPLLLGLALIAEKRKWSKPASLAVQAAGIILLILYGCSVPSFLENAPAEHLVRFFLLLFGLALFVSVAPFARSQEQNGFWHYNKTLVYRFVTAAFYAGVLQAGLSLALVALDQLFGIDITDKRYGELWALLVGVFGASFFLAGIPENLSECEKERDYPKSLKIFAQYILSTVVLVYLVILYAYMAKILLAWSWPQGWVSKLILGFSAVGLVALLLLYPIREQKETPWSRILWRWFFIVLIPLIIMLPLAVWRRISEYGLTEGRYLALALAVFLIILTLYYNLSKRKDVRVIPGLLCIMALFVCFGPWSVFTVSADSQKTRLQQLLLKNNLLVNHAVQKTATDVPAEDAVQISSILSYLYEMHGYETIQPWFAEELSKESKGRLERLKPAEVAEKMGIKYSRGASVEWGDVRLLGGDNQDRLVVKGYDFLLRGQFIGQESKELVLLENRLSCTVEAGLNAAVFTWKDNDASTDTMRLDLKGLVQRLHEEYSRIDPDRIPLEKMSVSAAKGALRVKIYLSHIRYQFKENQIMPMNGRMDILYSIGE
ncbi:DUF4153 domain-containing protein [bacterium]|nr:DUF4153 domain-containing protein [bacterium]